MGRREPGSNGGGQAGEEGAGGGISKRGGSRAKWQQFRNIGTIFRNRKSTQRREPLRKGVGTGSAGYGGREVQTPCLPPPPNCKGPVNTLAINLKIKQLRVPQQSDDLLYWLLYANSATSAAAERLFFTANVNDDTDQG